MKGKIWVRGRGGHGTEGTGVVKLLNKEKKISVSSKRIAITI